MTRLLSHPAVHTIASAMAVAVLCGASALAFVFLHVAHMPVLE